MAKSLVKKSDEILRLLQTSKDLVSFTQVINVGNEVFAERKGYDKPSIINRESIYYCLKNTSDCYHNFTIKKKSGADRNISAPQPVLKQIQKSIKTCIDLHLEISSNSHGFINGKSIISNSTPHVGNGWVLNMDIEDFFPSISYGRLYVVLQMPPLRCSTYVAQSIATLCTLNASLPQGAPTSPVFTNLICQRLDRKLGHIALKYNCNQTRYVDDITYSADSKHQVIKARKAVAQLLNKEGFSEKESKTRFQQDSMRQEVTGLTVNDFPNASRTFRRKTRAMLHDWKINGLEAAASSHSEGMSALHFSLMVGGRIAFINSVHKTTESLKLLQIFKENKHGK